MTDGDSDDLRQAQGRMATRIRAARNELNLSQEDLADIAQIDRTYVSQLERALVNPSLSVLIRVATALQMEAFQLIQ